MQQRSCQQLTAPWALDEDEAARRMRQRRCSRARGQPRRPRRYGATVSGRSGVRPVPAPADDLPGLLSERPERSTSTEPVIRDLLEALRSAGLVEPVDEARRATRTATSSQPQRDALAARATDTVPRPDPLRPSARRTEPHESTRSSSTSTATVAPTSRGHAKRASTPPRCRSDEREEREAAFRDGELPVLLLLADDGARRRHRRAERRQPAQRPADPGQLRPAQRPGRPERPAGAGLHLLLDRQRPRPVLLPPAASGWSPGQVAPPRLDLANEDLVRAHVHAIWLAETGPEPAARRCKDVLDVDGDGRACRCSSTSPASADRASTPSGARRARCRALCWTTWSRSWRRRAWYTPDWLDDVHRRSPGQLRRRPATAGGSSTARRCAQADDAEPRSSATPPRPRTTSEQAERLRREAEAQLELLIDERRPRPVATSTATATSPARASCPATASRACRSRLHPGPPRRRRRDEFLSRPRFLAISRVRAAQRHLPRGRPLPRSTR